MYHHFQPQILFILLTSLAKIFFQDGAKVTVVQIITSISKHEIEEVGFIILVTKRGVTDLSIEKKNSPAIIEFMITLIAFNGWTSSFVQQLVKLPY